LATKQPTDIDQIKARVEARIPQNSKDPEKDEIPIKFILDCLEMGPLGDGILYAHANKGGKVYNATTGYWLTWTGHRWAFDYEKKALACIDKVTDLYEKAVWSLTSERTSAAKKMDADKSAAAIKKEHKIFKRISRLQTERGRKETLHFSRTNNVCNLSTLGGKFDINPWLFACGNGVINLKTAELRPGLPGDFLTKGSDIHFLDIDEPAPVWENTLREIFEDDQELIKYLQRMLGYGMTALTTEHSIGVFWGHGRNGKGTIITAIQKVLGEYASPMPAEILLDQGRVRNSAAPSPDIMALKGLRIAWCSESDEGRKFSASKFKWLSGGDRLTGRNPHDIHPTNFDPSHLLFLSTNEKPTAPANDFAFWERLKLIPYRLSFVNREPVSENERKADKKLDFKLEKELPGILAWLVRGCIDWQEQGLNPPPVVTEATSQYRREEDTLADFLEECCHVDVQNLDLRIGASVLHTTFQSWWEINVSKWKPSQKKFGKLMRLRQFTKQKIKGKIYYIGLSLIDDISSQYETD